VGDTLYARGYVYHRWSWKVDGKQYSPGQHKTVRLGDEWHIAHRNTELAAWSQGGTFDQEGAMKKVLCVLALLLLPAVASAQQLTQEQVEELKAVQMGMKSIDRLQESKSFNQEQGDHYRQEHLQLASAIAGQPLPTRESLDELIRKNDTSRFWGFFTFINVVWVFAAIILVVALVALIGPYAIRWPGVFWESLGYIAIGVGLLSGYFWPALSIWFVVPACLLMIPVMTLTKFLHRSPSRSDQDAEGAKAGKGWVFFSYSQLVALVCTIVWSLATLYYQSYLLGFMSVMALEALLGFSVMVMPGCVAMGFEKEDNVPRATVASFAILLVYVLTYITGGLEPHMVDGKEVYSPLIYFKTGAIFMGSFVYYLGLLILASQFYNAKKGNYILLQIITIVSGVAAFFFGATFGINALLGVGGTFFVLYLLGKYAELPWKDIGWGWGLLGLAGLLYAAAWIAGKYPEYFLLGLR
jgi:hypothetical protein